jgi:hypothetical protein
VGHAGASNTDVPLTAVAYKEATMAAIEVNVSAQRLQPHTRHFSNCLRQKPVRSFSHSPPSLK